uniref:Uncharacterized protein LOC8266480 isoform X2 n=1 Tax=Rhizophora mucronata TaxID=61149 RepID=A0A2P2IK78_RHIMU
MMVDFVTWDHWKLESLSYFFDKRTVRLVSGASLIFSAPKIQWVQMFEHLNMSAKCKDDNLLATIELLLLGCIASKWNRIIEHFMSVSYESSTISKLHHDVCNLLPGESQSFCSKEEPTNSKVFFMLYLRLI